MRLSCALSSDNSAWMAGRIGAKPSDDIEMSSV
jgi:hypothetical protein